MASLKDLASRVKNYLRNANDDYTIAKSNLASKLWQPAVNIQKSIERGDQLTRFKQPQSVVQQKPVTSFTNAALDIGQRFINTPLQTGYDVTRAMKSPKGYQPVGDAAKFGRELVTLGTTLPRKETRNQITPQLIQAAKQGFKAFRPVMEARGFTNSPTSIAAYPMLSAGLSYGGGRISGQTPQQAKKGAVISAGESFERAPTIAGVTSITNPIIEKLTYGKPFTQRAFMKSALNVLEGMGINPFIERPVTEDVVVDAVLPVIFEGGGEAFKVAKPQLYNALRNSLKRGEIDNADDIISKLSQQGIKVRLKYWEPFKETFAKSLKDERGEINLGANLSRATANDMIDNHISKAERYMNAGDYSKAKDNLDIADKIFKDNIDDSGKIDTKVASLYQQLEDMTNKAPTVNEILKGESGVMRPGAKVEVPQMFKKEKFSLSKADANKLDKLRKTLGYEKRNVRSFEDMKDMADELGTTPQRLLNDITNKRITDSEVIALGNVIGTSTKRISKLTKELGKTPNDLNIKAQISAEEQLLNQAIAKRISGGTEAGRSVVAFKILANKTMEPVYWLDKAKRQVGEGKELNADNVEAINRLIKDKDRLGLATYISSLGESTASEKFLALWKAGLLSGPKTHLRNIISNSVFGTLETIKDAPATAFDKVRSAITGNPRAKTFTVGTVTDQGKGFIKGAKIAKDMMSGGTDPRDIAKIEIYKPIRFGDSKGGKAAQAFVNTIFNSLGAEDKVFREMAFSKSIREQATLEGINKSLSAEEVSKLIENPTESMSKVAMDDSLYATFNNDNSLSNAIRGAKARGGTKVSFVMDMIAPFTRTPTNVAKAFLDYSPGGVALTAVKKIINKSSVSDRELAEAFGRTAAGATVIWAGYTLAENGLVSGPSPSSPSERSQKEIEKKLDNAVFINGRWRSINAISPFGNLILLGASFFDTGSVSKTAKYGVKSLTEQTFLKGLSGALQSINEPDRYGGGFIEGLSGSMSPNWLKSIARGIDVDENGNRIVRDPQNAVESLQQNLPFLRSGVTPKTTALGDTKTYEGGFIRDILDPFLSTSPSEDPVVKEFSRVGYDLNKVGDTLTIDGEKVNLTPIEADAYQRLVGSYVRDAMNELMNDPKYQSMSEDKQLTAVEKTVTDAKTAARDAYKEDRPNPITGNALKIYSGLSGGYESTNSQSKFEKLLTYGNGLFKDPEGTASAIINGAPIIKVSGDAVITERMKSLSTLDEGNQDTEVDHIIPKALGGTDKETNLQIISKQDNRAKGVIDKYLSDQLKAGEITKLEAQEMSLNWRYYVDNLPSKEKKQVENILSEPVTERTTTSSMPTLGVYSILNEETGKTTEIDLSKPIDKPKLTGLKELDAKLISSYNGKIASRINQIEKVYLDGQVSAKVANDAIAALKDRKISTSKSGSKRKGVKVSMPKITTKKVNIKSYNTDLPALNIPQPPKIKFSKIPNLNIAQPKGLNFKIKEYGAYKPAKFTNTLTGDLTKLL